MKFLFNDVFSKCKQIFVQRTGRFLAWWDKSLSKMAENDSKRF